MGFSWPRAYAVAEKEIFHVLRDPFTLSLALGLPLFMVFVFGFAIEFNVKNIAVAGFDADQTQSSRKLVDIFGSSHYFQMDMLTGIAQAEAQMMNNRGRALLLIPGGFQANVFANRTATVQLLLDGSDNSTVAPILSYLGRIQEVANQRLAEVKAPTYIQYRTRFLFNPELNSQWFIIPGLLVVIMAILSVLLTALTVAREWENGSMELLLSTPLKPLEIIVGKLTPYALLCLLAVTMVYIISRTVFHIPFRGSLWILGLGTLLFLTTYLAQGLLISVLTRSQQVAIQIAIMSGMLPAQLLSGFIFPIDNMPTFFRYFTMILPARWFMTIARQSYLKGSTLQDLLTPFLALSVLCALMLWLATRQFKRDVEP